VQTSPLLAWRRTLAPSRLAAPPPPSRGKGGSRDETQQHRRSSTPPPARLSSPLLHTSPSPVVDGAVRGALQELSPRPPASPATGVAGRAGRLAGNHTLPGSHPITTPAPTWASIVRDGALAIHTAVSRQDFLALFERCVDSDLRTHLILRHQAGSNKITISCRLSAPTSDASAPPGVRRRCRLRKRAPAAAGTSLAPPQDPGIPHPTTPSSPTSTPRESPPPAETASPPSKRTRKAAKHRCEAELLRERVSDEDLQLSTLSHCRQAPPINPNPAPAIPPPPDPPPAADEAGATPTPPPAASPLPASPLLASSPILCSPPMAQFSPLGPPSPACATRDHPSPSAALVLITTPQSSHVSPPLPAPATGELAEEGPLVSGPPTPPPWPEAYVFSTDPDRIVFRKCCNRHYNFRSYSHCFMCNKR
jgi:hypothetical protein